MEPVKVTGRAWVPGSLDKPGTMGRVRTPWARFTSDRDSLLHDMYELLECSTVQCVTLTPTVSLWCDEEFLFRQEYWFEKLGRVPVLLAGGHQIMGNAIFLGGVDTRGNTRNLDLGTFNKIRADFKFGYLPEPIGV